MALTVETTEKKQDQEFIYQFQNETGEKWIANIVDDSLWIEKLTGEFKKIQLTLDEVRSEIDGSFDVEKEYDFDESCSLRSCEFTQAESYWILSVLLSAAKTMKNA